MSGVWLVLPTYNEAENIEPFLRAVVPRLAEAAPAHRVLIVDDNSPDGTGEIADRLAAELDPVEVMHRAGKEGLGRAYLAGFARALDAGADRVMEMDSDFSHDPADVPRLLAACERADIALGSRYVRGGGVVNWPLHRRLLSKGGSWYARHVLGVGVRDLTGGFKCIHRRVLEQLDMRSIQADGYGFQIEVTYRAIQAGFKVEEVPITFKERERGASKMTPWIALEAVWKVPALRFRRD
ncbi:MAG TPA: polyprenol monophosphomannose synthase [Thermoleophilaceae bacterium]